MSAPDPSDEDVVHPAMENSGHIGRNRPVSMVDVQLALQRGQTQPLVAFLRQAIGRQHEGPRDMTLVSTEVLLEFVDLLDDQPVVEPEYRLEMKRRDRGRPKDEDGLRLMMIGIHAEELYDDAVLARNRTHGVRAESNQAAAQHFDCSVAQVERAVKLIRRERGSKTK